MCITENLSLKIFHFYIEQQKVRGIRRNRQNRTKKQDGTAKTLCRPAVSKLRSYGDAAFLYIKDKYLPLFCIIWLKAS